MEGDRWWLPFAGAMTYALLRLVDYLLPTGRHWRFMDRFTRKNDERRAVADREETEP